MAKRPKKPDAVGSAAYIGASLTYSDLAPSRGATLPDYALAARAVTSTVYSACNINATACASQPLRLYRPKGGSKAWPGRAVAAKTRRWMLGGGVAGPHTKAVALASRTSGEFEEVDQHPLLDLLYDPNPYTTATQFAWSLHFAMETAGRAYVYVGERAGTEPASLYLLPPQYTSIVASETEYVKGYEYGVEGGRRVRLPAEDVIYVRMAPHPSRPLHAISWVSAVALASDAENAALTAEVARWANNGAPGMVLEVDNDTTDDQVRQIEAWLAGNIRGVMKTGRPLVLRRAKLVQYGPKPHEMAYREGMERAETLIYRAAGIPEPVWKMASSNRASAAQADPQYMANTILPRINVVAEHLTNSLLPMFAGTEGWWLAYDNPVAEDRVALLDEVTKLTDRGLLTGNQGLTILGFDKGGPELDAHRTAGGQLIQSEAATKVEPEPQAIVAAPANPEVLSSLAADARAGHIPVDTAKAIASSAFPGMTPEQIEAVFAPVEKAIEAAEAERREREEAKMPEPSGGGDDSGGDSPDGDDPPSPGDDGGMSKALDACRAQDRGVEHGSTVSSRAWQLTKSMDTESSVLARALLDWYTRAARQTAATGGDVPQAATDELERIVTAGVDRIFRAGAAGGLESLGDPSLIFTAASQRAAEYARTRAATMVVGVTETLRDSVRTVVEQVVGGGGTLADVQMAITDDFGAGRAESIARTETATAFNEGMRQAWEDVGVTEKVWVLAGGPCPVCEAVAERYNAPVPIGDAFYRAGDVVVGTDGNQFAVSADVLAPPIHPQCRCTLAAGGVR